MRGASRLMAPRTVQQHLAASGRSLRYTGALAPMAKLVDATDLKQLSGSRGNALPDPVKVGEPPGIPRGNAEPIRTAQSGRQV